MTATSHKEILLCSTPRSGSTLLAEAMFNSKCMGYPDEFFNNNQENKGDRPQTIFEENYTKVGATSYADYLGKLAAHYQSDNGVHSVKMHFQHFNQALRSGYFQHPAERSYVYIYRADTVAQAVSLAIAITTQKWNSRMQSSVEGDVEVSDELLARAYRELVFDNLRWKAFFEMFNVPHLSLEYDDITADVAKSVRKIAKHAGVKLTRGALDGLEERLTGKKQASDLNKRLKARLKGMTLEGYKEGNILFDTKVL
ncbi:sulfotransferase domain-containing protein [Sulfitobacter albidus]|uniref:Sulfotransferase domain-containing protein n=1 Tax=Sulfitobacter albidus TaxID=2829501 RepID=A0A975JCV2_9RHOB|nr:Stf0 family sulfotransferase [Sulfitobacter albidus]QUJ76017.1 sulfotransferase domain-containing protein [Sulfitobacter albidus]